MQRANATSRIKTAASLFRGRSPQSFAFVIFVDELLRRAKQSPGETRRQLMAHTEYPSINATSAVRSPKAESSGLVGGDQRVPINSKPTTDLPSQTSREQQKPRRTCATSKLHRLRKFASNAHHRRLNSHVARARTVRVAVAIFNQSQGRDIVIMSGSAALDKAGVTADEIPPRTMHSQVIQYLQTIEQPSRKSSQSV